MLCTDTLVQHAATPPVDAHSRARNVLAFSLTYDKPLAHASFGLPWDEGSAPRSFVWPAWCQRATRIREFTVVPPQPAPLRWT